MGTRFAGQIGLLGEMGKNAFNSVGTLALKPEITVTSMTGKLKTRWRINAGIRGVIALRVQGMGDSQ
ncbi:MAG: hypothetical protein WC856_22420 [Methylococcaceae bacterium]